MKQKRRKIKKKIQIEGLNCIFHNSFKEMSVHLTVVNTTNVKNDDMMLKRGRCCRVRTRIRKAKTKIRSLM